MQARLIASTALVSLLVLPLVSTAFVSSLTMRPAFDPRIGEGSNSSLNWSGYAVTGSTRSVTTVSGSWTVTSLVCQKGTTYAAYWAGIDGFSSNTVEQAGVLARCSGGVASYSAWYEFYPSPSVTISSITVKPGDTVSVTVAYGSGTFTITLIDGSQSYVTQGTVSNAARSSAECITERPSIGGSMTKLADFGTINFGQDYTLVPSTCSATINGVNGSFGTFGAALQEITMVNRHGGTLALPSAISTDGSSFTITWFASN